MLNLYNGTDLIGKVWIDPSVVAATHEEASTLLIDEEGVAHFKISSTKVAENN